MIDAKIKKQFREFKTLLEKRAAEAGETKPRKGFKSFSEAFEERDAEMPVTGTKKYTDGTVATGVEPLPDMSPRQQEVKKALQCLGDIEAIMGGRNGPSIELRALIKTLGTPS